MTKPVTNDKHNWHPAGVAVWLVVAGASTVALAWLSVRVQEAHFAPLGLFPILVGLALGGALAGAMRLCRMAYRPAAYVGTLLAWLLVVVGQHYASYLAERAAAEARRASGGANANFAKAMMVFPELAPPESFGEYMRREARQGRALFGHQVSGAALWCWWSFDAALSLAAALAVVVWALRQPYCPRCRSWFRTTRQGRAAPGTALALAEIGGLAPAAGPAHYRLLTCRSGCGPALFELSWDEARGRAARAWLDAEARRRATELLDRQGPRS